jgi:hypothetical protein
MARATCHTIECENNVEENTIVCKPSSIMIKWTSNITPRMTTADLVDKQY